MDMQTGVDRGERYAFNRMFVKDWIFTRKFGRQTSDQRQRWHDRMVKKMEGQPPGRELTVERRAGLTPEQFRREYFLTGKPVVLEGAGREWPAVKKWTFAFLMERCGQDRIDVLDGHNWKVSRREGDDVVSTAERAMEVRELLAAARTGSGWYGAFMELLDKYEDLRRDIDLDFVRRYGSMNPRVPWQRDILAKMYVGGPMTATSLHCAPVMNLYRAQPDHDPVGAAHGPDGEGLRVLGSLEQVDPSGASIPGGSGRGRLGGSALG